MSMLEYKNSELYIENVSLNEIAIKYSTPCYVYSKQALTNNWRSYAETFNQHNKPYKIFYALKANSNLAILNLLAKLGAGFDAVSGGEITRVIAAGGKAADIVFSGVGKSSEEIRQAIELGVHCINIESAAELERVQAIAQQLGKKANIALRVNPDITVQTHPYISTGGKANKFGIDHTQSVTLYQQAAKLPNLKIKGISCHIGSQITSLEPFLLIIDQLLILIKELAKHNIHLEHLDIGGGLGIRYKDEIPPTPQEYVNAIMHKLSDCQLSIHIEPGRSIVANAGILLTKVEYLKTNEPYNFAIVDAAMNDLIRPALYESYHEILTIKQADPKPGKTLSVVGPVCESGDFFGKDRQLNVQAGDLLAINTCGAYGFCMSSNYNTRPRCAEVLVDDNKTYLIRKRETVEELFANEKIVNV